MVSFIYGLKQEDFPRGAFSNTEYIRSQARTESISKEVLQDIHQGLIKDKKYDGALIIHIMFALALRCVELRFIVFENVFKKSQGYSIKIFRTKNNKFQKISISEELYDEIMQKKKRLQDEGNYFNDIRYSSKETEVKGHFLFNYTEKQIYDRFKKVFGPSVAKDFEILPSSMRISAISDQTGESTIANAAKLSKHSNVKVIRQHYLKSQQPFKTKEVEETKGE